MARQSTVEIFGTDVQDSLTQCEPEGVEYSMDSIRKSVTIKN